MTTLDADYDGAVRRITWGYDGLGRVATVTQYDHATVGSGSVVDEVAYAYDGWGTLATFEQDHDSAIGGTLVYDVDYAYAKATSGRNTLRRTGMGLPNGDDVAFTYSSSAHDAAASRVSTVTLDIGGGAVTIASYDYNGAGHLVGTDYPAIEVMSLQYGSTSGAYPDLDRFDRVTSSRWTKDLATDRDLYDLDVTYDRNSNILRVEDHVQTGFDVAYTMDDLNRLTVADQGTWTGSAITSTTRTEDWTLDQVGNWDEYDLDEDGDTTLELNETRGHTLANELNSRNTNSTGPAEYEPEYDGAGHLVDDTEDYAYVWDAFGRLRQVKETGTGDLVAEYTYNGLGYRIGWHYDADTDGDVDGSDPWYRFVYDERWRIVATYRGSDSDPKEQFVHHAAGDSGYGTASYIDDVILRDRDDNSGWTSAADGTLEERIYHCQNWRHDVVALVDGNGAQVEMARYSPYGVPFGLPAGDLDSDGDVDAADLTVFDALIAYDVRADLDLDGDYDVTDRNTINANRGTSAGLGVLSQEGVASRKGYAGYAFAPELQDARSVYHVRHRVLDADLGRWMRRDPVEANWTVSLYAYAMSPLTNTDPLGLVPEPIGEADDEPAFDPPPNRVPRFPIDPNGVGCNIFRRAFPLTWNVTFDPVSATPDSVLCRALCGAGPPPALLSRRLGEMLVQCLVGMSGEYGCSSFERCFGLGQEVVATINCSQHLMFAWDGGSYVVPGVFPPVTPILPPWGWDRPSRYIPRIRYRQRFVTRQCSCQQAVHVDTDMVTTFEAGVCVLPSHSGSRPSLFDW